MKPGIAFGSEERLVVAHGIEVLRVYTREVRGRSVAEPLRSDVALRFFDGRIPAEPRQGLISRLAPAGTGGNRQVSQGLVPPGDDEQEHAQRDQHEQESRYR